MSKLTPIQKIELNTLNVLVAIINNVDFDKNGVPIWYEDDATGHSVQVPYDPTGKWSVGGPIMNSMNVGVVQQTHGNTKCVSDTSQNGGGCEYYYGDTLLEAHMRALVAFTFGNHVDVEDVLLNVKVPKKADETVRYEDPPLNTPVLALFRGEWRVLELHNDMERDGYRLRTQDYWCDPVEANDPSVDAKELDPSLVDRWIALPPPEMVKGDFDMNDFDNWNASPYTEVLHKSIREDYVPREDASRWIKEKDDIIDKLERKWQDR